MDTYSNDDTTTNEVTVDFRQVDPSASVWAEVRGLTPGAVVTAVDGTGNRCQAIVQAIENGRAKLELILETFTAAG